MNGGCQGLEEWGKGELLLMGIEFKFYMRDGGDGFTQYECT